MHKNPLLMGIDVGTTNWKVAVFDENGQCLFVEKTPTITHYDDLGHSTYKPDEIWNAIATMIKKAVESFGNAISAVSVTSMAEAVVPIGEDGQPCSDIITWFDNRSQAEARNMVEVFGRDKLYEITGLDPNPIFSICKMLWMRNHHPEIYNQSRKWLQMTDFIIYKLTGQMRTDYTLASRTLAFDVRKNDWSDEILEKMEVTRSLLPDIVESGSVIGKVTELASIETGLKMVVPVVMGGNDHPCAGLPAGVLTGKKILDSSGTAESIIYVSDKGETPAMRFEGQRTCRYLEKDRFAMWGGIVSSGASFEWAYKSILSSEEWGLGESSYTYEMVLDQLKDRKPGAGGVLFIPHLRGSGAPDWNPKMKGSFLGIKSTTTQKDLLQAVMEGLSFQARIIIEMYMDLTGGDIDGICVVGGSGKNRVWQQIKADILQLPIEICEESEATALGAAMLAGVGCGVFESMTDASKKMVVGNEVIINNPAHKEAYDALFKIYKKACESTRQVSELLHDYMMNEEN